MKNTLYLVTGAAGFLGGHVCRQLIERCDKVRAFALPGDKAIQFIPKEVEVVEGNLCNLEDVDRFFSVPEGTETICLHIASVVTVSPDYNPLVMNVNVGGTKNIILCCERHPECKKLVYCSSTGAIPEEKKGRKMREVIYFDEDQTVGCYSRSKAIASQAVLDAANIDGLNACIVHPSGILGPEDPAIGETTKTLIDIINGEMPMGMDGSFDYSKAQRELGYTTRPYNETIRDEIAWLKQEGKIA